MGNFRLASASASAAADAVTKRVDGGFLRLYTASDQPGSPDTPVPGRAILLVELPFGSPAYQPADGGEAEAFPIGSARAVGSGEPQWYRALTANREPVFDGSVGIEKSGADLELGAGMIVAGAEVLVTSALYRQPMSRNGRR